MNEANLDILAAVIGAISAKSWLDYVPALLAGFAPLLAIWMSWKFFHDQHIQNAKSKIIEKDVERLYGAADLFFEYSDAMNLFLSMVFTKAKYIDRNEQIPESVELKTVQATDDVYPKINSIYKSYFFLRSLGANELADKVASYRNDTIDFRKNILRIAKMKDFGADVLTSEDKALIDEIATRRTNFTKERDEILVGIAEYKNVLISSALN